MELQIIRLLLIVDHQVTSGRLKEDPKQRYANLPVEQLKISSPPSAGSSAEPVGSSSHTPLSEPGSPTKSSRVSSTEPREPAEDPTPAHCATFVTYITQENWDFGPEGR
ncbi:MAG: hypothetical protein ABSA92_05415 [Candidatus Bathyarchaeia archaeon]